MEKHSSKSGLRVIAVKPHDNCRSRYSKILSDRFYIFYDDYEERRGKLMKKEGEALTKVKVPGNFYPTKNNVAVSISAIIGKNGDGKSTIVELIMRLLNNFAYASGFTESQNSLKKIDKLEAELYYELNDSLYCIISEGDKIIWKKNGKDLVILGTSSYDLKDNKRKIDIIGLGKHFFYTQVSNYSLYAYNSKELEGESLNGHWIDGVFHKNDGYQTPIVLNPMRTEGNIDINIENDLTKQRLISLLITDTSEDSFRWINDKQLAQAFQITLFEKTKLELTTFVNFFKNYSEKGRRDYFPPEKGETRDIGNYIDNIPIVQVTPKKHDSRSREAEPKRILKYNGLLENLHNITRLIDETVFRKFLLQSEGLYNEVNKIHKTIYEYTRKLKTFARSDSEIVQIFKNKIDEVDNYFRSNIEHIDQIDQDEDDLKGYMNFVFLQRIITVAMCEEIWKEKLKDKNITTKENITNKIMDYLVYKTISVVSKYPNYKNLSENIFTAIDFTTNNEKIQSLKDNLESAIDKIWEDINKTKSHITLKMRQCINFLEDHPYGNQKYTDNEVQYVNASKFYYKIKKGKDQTKINLYDYFFPPIFNSDILLKQIKGDKKKVIEAPVEEGLFAYYNLDNNKELTLFSQLSSGERQQINVVSAVIYHLRNIDSVSDKDLVKYWHVNLIFEEIELYFHPEFQRIFLYFLLEHVSKTKLNLESINLCFVTHSPFILSDIPQQNILVLQKGEPLKDKPFNLGANIHEMLGHNFMLEYTTGEVVRHKINEFLIEYSKFKKFAKAEKSYVFPKNNNFYFLIKNMGEGYLKSLLNGYYEEMMQSSSDAYNELIKQKEAELEELRGKMNNRINIERIKK